MSEIKTSFTFSLGTETTKSVSAEIDTRPAYQDGDNATRLGKTSGFDCGESIGFLVYLPPEATVQYIETSLDSIGASISWYDTESILKTEQITFQDSINTEATLANHVKNDTILDGFWIGNNLGTVTLLNDRISIRIPQLPPDATSQQQRMTGIYQITYQTKAKLFRLNTSNRETMNFYGKPPYPINIVIYTN